MFNFMVIKSSYVREHEEKQRSRKRKERERKRKEREKKRKEKIFKHNFLFSLT